MKQWINNEQPLVKARGRRDDALVKQRINNGQPLVNTRGFGRTHFL
ncbi:MAG: hypothetical protein WAM79_06165 [Candidatus Sulfotelmatobacter sp.]